MAAMLGRDEDPVGALSGRVSLASTSHRSLVGASKSFRDVFMPPADEVFGRSERREEDDMELRWAAIERLPTFDRLRKGKIELEETDLTRLEPKDKKHLMEMILSFVEEDNEKFLRDLRERTDR